MHEREFVFLNINLAPRPLRTSSTVPQSYASAIQQLADQSVSNAVRDSMFLSLCENVVPSCETAPKAIFTRCMIFMPISMHSDWCIAARYTA